MSKDNEQNWPQAYTMDLVTLTKKAQQPFRDITNEQTRSPIETKTQSGQMEEKSTLS